MTDDKMITLNLTRVGDQKTGYGIIPKYVTEDEAPRISHEDWGMTWTDAKTDEALQKWIWINGPDWEAMLYSGKDGLYFTGMMGGIQLHTV